MKIATYNVNSVNARLPLLLRWLADSKPDAACLQELKAPQERFSFARNRKSTLCWQTRRRLSSVAPL